MSREELTTTDRLLFGIEQALNQTYGIPSDDPSISAELLAERGRAGITSLYVEGFRAVDRLPKTFTLRRFGKTALSNEARDLMQFVDEAIELNPLYDHQEYSAGKDSLDYAKPLYRPIEPTPPRGYLTDRNYRNQFAEHGLAAMYHSVSAGFSARSPGTVAWRAHTPYNLQRTMTLNGAIDPDVMTALAQAKSEESYTTQEYVAGLVTLAEKTTHELTNTRKGMVLERRSENDELALIQQAAGNLALFGSGVTMGLSLIEGILVFENHHTITHIAVSIASAVAAIILRKTGSALRDGANA